jgi:hypothetical protein
MGELAAHSKRKHQLMFTSFCAVPVWKTKEGGQADSYLPSAKFFTK